MMCNLFHKFYLTLICVITGQDFVSTQVNTNITEFVHEIISPTKERVWFHPQNITEYSKFMICVDIYQKILGISLVNEHYITDNGTTNLPIFKLVRVNVRYTNRHNTTSVTIKVIHCPLHKVQFSSLDYNYGEEFYISASRVELCFYIHTQINEKMYKPPILETKAKVCESMVNVRYNRLELDQEFSTIKTELGLDLVKWSKIKGLDNEMRFIICLDVHEKLSRIQLYSFQYRTVNNRNSLPGFNIAHKNLKLTNTTAEVILENLEVLYCPLNEIAFPHQLSTGVITPFYLAKSFRKDCVYKLTPDLLDLKHASVFHIKAEICDIFGTVDNNNNAEYSEEDLKERIAVSKDPSFNFFLWDELAQISQTFRYYMCINVMKKVHLKYIFMKHANTSVRTGYSFPTIDSYKLKLDHHGMDNKPITVYQCPLNMFTNHDLAKNPFYLANSPRIGCVYSLSSASEANYSETMLLKIDKLICGIYPSRHILQLNNKKYVKEFINETIVE